MSLTTVILSKISEWIIKDHHATSALGGINQNR